MDEPSTPVNVTGLDVPPGAGDHFYVLSDIAQARTIAEKRSQQSRQATLGGAPTHVTESSAAGGDCYACREKEARARQPFLDRHPVLMGTWAFAALFSGGVPRSPNENPPTVVVHVRV